MARYRMSKLRIESALVSFESTACGMECSCSKPLQGGPADGTDSEVCFSVPLSVDTIARRSIGNGYEGEMIAMRTVIVD